MVQVLPPQPDRVEITDFVISTFLFMDALLKPEDDPFRITVVDDQGHPTNTKACFVKDMNLIVFVYERRAYVD